MSEITDRARQFLEELNNESLKQAESVYINLFIRTNADGLSEVIDEVTDYFRTVLSRSRVFETKIEMCLRVIIANILNSKNGYVSYRKLKNDFTNGSYNPFRVSYSVFVDTVEALDDLGYIKHHKGLKSQAKIKQISKFKPLNKLSNLLSDLKITRISEVEVKDDNKKRIECKNPKLKTIKRNLEFINTTLDKYSYSLGNDAVKKPVFKRVFNKGSLSYGGRFYSIGAFNFQGLQEEKRAEIRIDNQRIVEIDYKSIHPNILYSMIDKELDHDPYLISGVDRKIVKVVFLILVNSKSELMVKRAVKEKLGYPHSFTTAVINKILEKNVEIKDLFFKNDIGLRLQNIDSKIAEQVMLKYINSCGRAILSVHDSFIVIESDKSLLKSIMMDVYKDTTGFSIELS